LAASLPVSGLSLSTPLKAKPHLAVPAPAERAVSWRAFGYAALFWLGVYVLIAPVDIIENLQMHHSMVRELCDDAFTLALWTLLSPLSLWLVAHMPVEGARRYRNLGVHAALAVAAAPTLLSLAYLFCLAVFGPLPKMDGHAPWPMWKWVLVNAIYNLTVYFGFITMAHAMRFLKRSEERERLLAQAQVQALKAQLNPHFLYNTLNAVSEFAYKDAATAERLITMLSDLLRLSFAGGDAAKVPLADEMAFVRRYLDIQQLLLEDRLQVRYAFAPGALQAQVPNFILQPLVENAVVHGVSRRAAIGHIELGASVADGELRLWVKDDGPGLASASPRGHGIGLSHTRARLTQLYGGQEHLALESPEGGGFSAQLRLPYEQAEVT
jgi:two-component system, LytTR family, sensor kinase